MVSAHKFKYFRLSLFFLRLQILRYDGRTELVADVFSRRSFPVLEKLYLPHDNGQSFKSVSPTAFQGLGIKPSRFRVLHLGCIVIATKCEPDQKFHSSKLPLAFHEISSNLNEVKISIDGCICVMWVTFVSSRNFLLKSFSENRASAVSISENSSLAIAIEESGCGSTSLLHSGCTARSFRSSAGCARKRSAFIAWGGSHRLGGIFDRWVVPEGEAGVFFLLYSAGFVLLCLNFNNSKLFIEVVSFEYQYIFSPAGVRTEARQTMSISANIKSNIVNIKSNIAK